MSTELSEDPRWQQLADVLTAYSVAVAFKQRVFVTMLEAETFPLVREVHRSVIHAGGYPQIEFQSAFLERDLLTYGTKEQIEWVPELSRYGLEWADAYIGIRGAGNPLLLDGIPAPRVSAHRRAMGVLSALRTTATRWVLVRVPSGAMAAQAGMTLEEMMELFFHATLKDWPKEAAEYRRIGGLFEGAAQVRILAEGTDLEFHVTGRRFVVEDGHINMPGGELYTAPVEDSVQGTIRFSFPGVFAGQMVTGVVLRFADGKLVSAAAEQNEELLHSLLSMDPGASRIGEFGVGLNRALDRRCGDPLYDEKIWGTVHIALGRSYGECGGVNQSALHWDLVTDLRSQGEIHVDGLPVFSSGRFLV